MEVGFAGIGLMGAGMARNLLRAGHDVVIWNRSRSATEALADDGARVAERPADLSQCAVVGMCLPTGAIVEEVLFGPDGVLTAAGAEGRVIVDHSTISASDARAIAERCTRAGHEFLDAPVSGGPQGAEAGTLAVMVGGDTDALAAAEPVVAAYSASIIHMGPSGAGQTAKLVNQICIALTVHGLAEGFRLGLSHGLDPQALYELLCTATADSVMLRTRAPVAGLQPGMPASNDWQPGFRADFMLKDLDFALAAADEAGCDLPGVRHVREALAALVESGDGLVDWTRFAAVDDLS